MNKIYTSMPAGCGECPQCQGTGRVPATAEQQRYARVMAGYNTADNTVNCRNCGGQYMFGRSLGFVKLGADGDPCQHQYRSETAGRCLTRYTCQHCGDVYKVDSSD